MPPALRRAHEKLDKEILKVYGLATSATDEEILATLIRLHLEAKGELAS
jgi:hypothetical protein